MKECGAAALLALTFLSLTAPRVNGQRPNGNDGPKCGQITSKSERFNIIGRQGDPLSGALPKVWGSNTFLPVRLALFSPYEKVVVVPADYQVMFQSMEKDVARGSIG